MKKVNLKWILSATVAAAMLAACGGGVSPTPLSTNTSTAVTAATAAGLAGTTPYTFASGIAEFGTSASTTVGVTSTAGATTFDIASGTDTASGPMTFGSCIFKITKSTFKAPSPLAVGGPDIKINPCTLDIKSAGYSAGSQSIPTVWTIGKAKSGDTIRVLSIDANGDPKVGTVTLTGTGS